jgi:hypothetical protein
MIINTNRHDKLSAYHVLHIIKGTQVLSFTVDKWISDDPVLLYQAIMGQEWCCVILPSKKYYRPSLQQPVLKKLEREVQKLRPDLILQKEERKAKRSLKKGKS